MRMPLLAVLRVRLMLRSQVQLIVSAPAASRASAQSFAATRNGVGLRAGVLAVSPAQYVIAGKTAIPVACSPPRMTGLVLLGVMLMEMPSKILLIGN